MRRSTVCLRSALARGCSQTASCLSDVQYAVIVVLRRRVGLEVVFDESVVFGVQELMRSIRVSQHIGSWSSSFVVYRNVDDISTRFAWDDVRFYYNSLPVYHKGRLRLGGQ